MAPATAACVGCMLGMILNEHGSTSSSTRVFALPSRLRCARAPRAPILCRTARRRAGSACSRCCTRAATAVAAATVAQARAAEARVAAMAVARTGAVTVVAAVGEVVVATGVASLDMGSESGS